MDRGLDRDLAKKVSEQLMAHDALGAHARDELGISESMTTHPIQAALTSAFTFAMGASLPLLLVFFVPASQLMASVSGASLGFLAVLGMLAARAGGANAWRGALRVTFWGALALGLTAGIGSFFGTLI